LPSEKEFKEQINQVTMISKEDPSKQYDILGKLGQGGFAKVFKVKRKSDGFICALKFVEPKNEKERNIILNEVGLMQMCTENNLMLKVLEAYDYKERLWIFVELMDDALTSYVQNWWKSYSENICRYVLRRALEALNYLHERNIIHRDIKSDNLLMSVNGDVKLADFGYAV
jgi:p21-activated kinase 1